MKWYSSKRYRPGQTGDQIIFRLLSGDIHGGILDRQKDIGLFFETHSGERFTYQEITHFCIPDPIEIE
jgi:hypothetical protein